MFLTPGKLGGTATYSWQLIERMQHNEHLSLVLFVQDGYVPDSIDRRLVTVIRCPRFNSTWRRALWEQFTLPRWAKDQNLNVLWSTGYVSPRFTHCPRVVTVHDMFFVRVPAAIPFIRRQYYRVFIPWSVRSATEVLAVSAMTADDLAHEIPKSVGKVTVVHLAARPNLIPVDAEGNPTTPAHDAHPYKVPYFLQVASATRNKNVATVVTAAVALASDGTEFKVIFAGDDPYGILADAMHLPGAREVCVAEGTVSDARLSDLYQGALASINPSIYEGFGLPVLEAQALGVPVISSRGGSLPEVAGDAALYFDHDQPTQLTDAMRLLLTQTDEVERLVAAGAENLKRFSWDRAADETTAVLLAAAK